MLLSLIAFTSIVRAAPDPQLLFDQRLREYFSQFEMGRPVVQEIYYPGPVAAEYPPPARSSEGPARGRIEHEVAFARVFDVILCRIGVGDTGFAENPAVYGECVPMTEAQRRESASDDPLPEQFEVARTALLGDEVSTWGQVRTHLYPSATEFAFVGLPPRLVASRLFDFSTGHRYHEPPGRFEAIYEGQLRAVAANTDPTTHSVRPRGELWTIDLNTFGRTVPLSRAGCLNALTAAVRKSTPRAPPAKKNAVPF